MDKDALAFVNASVAKTYLLHAPALRESGQVLRGKGRQEFIRE